VLDWRAILDGKLTVEEAYAALERQNPGKQQPEHEERTRRKPAPIEVGDE